MRHRIFHDGDLTQEEVSVTGEELHHASRVVRVREGEEVELLDGRGTVVTGAIVAVDRSAMRVRITGPAPSRESPFRVTLAMAIIQLEKFELVLQKATELGVAALIPVMTERVEVRPERYRGKAERWEKIVFEAVKQSGRSVIPSLEPPAAFGDVVRRPGVKFFFDADSAADEAPSFQAATLLIGPEGGWTQAEIEQARDQGCIFQRLGPRRLRAETAAMTATAIIAARHGDI
jgi:16S rRNA (uracil1498-N3)-methyltransferase